MVGNTPIYMFDKKTFAPIAKSREFLRLIPKGIFLQVKQVSPIGLIEKDFGSLATVTNGTKTKMETEFKLEDNQLGQYRAWLRDGFRLSMWLPQAQQLLGTRDTTTYLYQNKQIYPAFDRDNIADTEVVLWTTTSGRVAKIVRMTIDNETTNAQIVRLGDGATGAGSDASAANADWSVEIGAKQSLTFSESDCPLKKFSTGIVWQHSSGNQIRITLDVLEELEQPYGRDVAELFVYGDDVPYFQTYNETGITLPVTRVALVGWKYEVEEVETGFTPSVYTDVPARAYASQG